MFSYNLDCMYEIVTRTNLIIFQWKNEMHEEKWRKTLFFLISFSISMHFILAGKGLEIRKKDHYSLVEGHKKEEKVNLQWDSEYYNLKEKDTYPSAHVVRHSPLCNCNPLTHTVQFIRDTHCVHVCRHFAQTPASI